MVNTALSPADDAAAYVLTPGTRQSAAGPQSVEPADGPIGRRVQLRRTALIRSRRPIRGRTLRAVVEQEAGIERAVGAETEPVFDFFRRLTF